MRTLLGFAILLSLGCYTRLYNIGFPPYVCWDETHFGSFVNMYLNQTFFFDVHPPLGKMIFALAGYMNGYDGTFGFDQPGDSYFSEDHNLLVPFIQMRLTSAMFGIFLLPIVYHLMLTLTNCHFTALTSSCLVVFDIGMVTISQYIILDPILLFFVELSMLSIVKVSSLQTRFFTRVRCEAKDFTIPWCFWMLTAGVSLGCVVSVKFVGLLTIAFVGLWTVCDLWLLLGDYTHVSMATFFKHVLVRAFLLITLPLLIYTVTFYFNFALLSNTGKHAQFYSHRFQASLKGNGWRNRSIARHVESGAIVALQYATLYPDSVYLHSHATASSQQVGGFLHRDGNDLWKIKKVIIDDGQGSEISHGDLVEFTHLMSHGRLSVAKRRASPGFSHVTNHRLTVVNQSDALAAKWILQVVGSSRDANHRKLHAMTSQIKFTNAASDCCLCSSGKSAVDWQPAEISCVENSVKSEGCLWNVETLPGKLLSKNETYDVIELSFWEKMLETHKLMFHINSNHLGSMEDGSSPLSWPLNLEGQLFSQVVEQIHLIGTPLVWKLNLLSLAACPLLFAIFHLVAQRNSSRTQASATRRLREVETPIKCCWWLWCSWLLHFVPFCFAKRVVFFHHYFPAHLQATCVTGLIVGFLSDHVVRIVSLRGGRQLLKAAIFVALSCAVVKDFLRHCHLCYGK